VLWDKKQGKIVSNHFPDISLDIGSRFNQWAKHPDLDLYPEDLRAEIDPLQDEIYRNLNNGVYRAGFAKTQSAYEQAHEVFDELDKLEKRLSQGGPYLFGDRLTEADVRLWVTLARFDVVYYLHFKLNLKRIQDYPALWLYSRRLYAIPAFHDATRFDHIKAHYYGTHPGNNPLRIVPIGPQVDWSLKPEEAIESSIR
jgi:putative glutathione S-transferase